MERGKEIPLGIYRAPTWPDTDPSKPTVVIVSAHPDDETLTGMPLGIRYKKEGHRVVNIAVTLGRPEQYERRRAELRAACYYFGMDLVVPLANGLRDNIKTNAPDVRQAGVDELARIFRYLRPGVVITHHNLDAHHDHEATCDLTKCALEQVEGINCIFAEGEYWREMVSPNLQLEVTPTDLTHLLQGLSFHVGELQRSRYDLFMLPNNFDNARFGEHVTGWGSPAAKFDFSVMYRIRHFHDGGMGEMMMPLQLAGDQPIGLINF